MKIVIIIVITVMFGIGLGLSLNVSADEDLIPSWVKNTAEFWVGEQVSDAEFLNAIQYLLDNKILRTVDNLNNSSNEIYEKRITELEIENSELQNRIFDLKDRNSNKVVTYSIDIIPDYADELIVNEAVKGAFHNWERTNSKLDFLKVDKDGDVLIKFWKVPKNNVEFSALGAVDVLGCFDNCVITLALGDVDCTSRWSQFTVNSTQETMMHEIGHILGIEHTSKYPHLMYAPYAEFQTNELGYLIPKNIEEIPHIINQDNLFTEIEIKGKRIDELLRPWGLTLDEYYSGEKQPSSNRFYMETDQIVNPLIEERNDLVSQINCFTVYDQGID